MGRLTTHVLDTAHGRPAGGLHIELYYEGDNVPTTRTVTNVDGRCDGPLLEGEAFAAGRYQLVFHAGDYFAELGVDLPDPPFISVITGLPPVVYEVAAFVPLDA